MATASVPLTVVLGGLRMSLNLFFFSSRRRHTRWPRDWSSDVCSSDLRGIIQVLPPLQTMESMLFELIWVGEIGRASCRERVGRWVVGGLMENKGEGGGRKLRTIREYMYRNVERYRMRICAVVGLVEA